MKDINGPFCLGSGADSAMRSGAGAAETAGTSNGANGFWARHLRGLKAVRKTVVAHPHIIIPPLLLLGASLGLGLWVVLAADAAIESGHKSEAASAGNEAGNAIERMLERCYMLAQAMSSAISLQPSWAAINATMQPLAMGLLRQLPSGSTTALIAPSGVVSSFAPLGSSMAASVIGTDILNGIMLQESSLDPTTLALRQNATLGGPTFLWDPAGSTLVITSPVFVSGVSSNETFGFPQALAPPECGDLCYDAATATKWWGLVSVVISSDVLLGPTIKLSDDGYLFRLAAMLPISTVAESHPPPSDDTVCIAISIPNEKWLLCMSLESGSWGWVGTTPLIVIIVIFSVVAAFLFFFILVSRQEHQTLLESVMPRQAIRQLRWEVHSNCDGNPEDEDSSEIMDNGTPVERILGMLTELMHGHQPSMQDIMLVRNALKDSPDLYQPLNLTNHLEGAHMDSDVTSALMAQLGAGGGRGGTAARRGSYTFGPIIAAVETNTFGPASTAVINPGTWPSRGPSSAGTAVGATGHASISNIGINNNLCQQQRNSSNGGQQFANSNGSGILDDILDSEVGRRIDACDGDGGGSAANKEEAPHASSSVTTPSGLSWVLDSSSPRTSPPQSPYQRHPEGREHGSGVREQQQAADSTDLGNHTDREQAVASSGASNSFATLNDALRALIVPHDSVTSSNGAGSYLKQAQLADLSKLAASSLLYGGCGGGGGGTRVSPSPAFNRQLSTICSDRGSSENGRNGRGDGEASGSEGRLSMEVSPSRALMDEAERVLATADDWQFDAFRLCDVTNGHPLSTLSYYLMHRAGMLQQFNINGTVLARFLQAIEAGYLDNPYHNKTHAADVLQSMHVILHRSGMAPAYAGPLDMMGCYLAATIHDYEHLGNTNDFLINSQNDLALRYNDRSPMENHHLAAAFSLLRRPEFNFISHLTPSDLCVLRKLIIDLVLSTDMKQHFTTVGGFASSHRLSPAPAAASDPVRQSIDRGSHHAPKHAVSTDLYEGTTYLPTDESERVLGLQMALKCADLGHTCASLGVHLRWVSQLEEELFRQGDKERSAGMPISPLFDRYKQGITKSQVGFYDIVVMPLFHNFAAVFKPCKPMYANILQNYHYWKEQQQGTVPNSPHRNTNIRTNNAPSARGFRKGLMSSKGVAGRAVRMSLDLFRPSVNAMGRGSPAESELAGRQHSTNSNGNSGSMHNGRLRSGIGLQPPAAAAAGDVLGAAAGAPGGAPRSFRLNSKRSSNNGGRVAATDAAHVAVVVVDVVDDERVTERSSARN